MVPDQQVYAVGTQAATVSIRADSQTNIVIPPRRALLIRQINSSTVPYEYETTSPIPFIKVFKQVETASALVYASEDARAHTSPPLALFLLPNERLRILWGFFNGVTSYLCVATVIGELIDQ
jgi:hypothetical protein